jgi:hypothetical protein
MQPKTGEEWYRQNHKSVNFPEGNLVWFQRCWDEAIKFADGAKNIKQQVQIPEKKFRPLSWEEALPILDNGRIRLIGNKGWRIVLGIMVEFKKFETEDDSYSDVDLKDFEYVLNITDEPKKFEVEI